MGQTNSTLLELRSKMTKMPQHMVNVRVQDKTKVMNSPVVAAAIRQVESAMAGRGRVLLRPSGTEPVIRVMVEGDDEQIVINHAKDLAAIVSEAAS
jgi:phosphoglucosamine mutase